MLINKENETKQPNLLYIHSDQHNSAVIGCYGDPLVRTPNLDALAERGTIFTNVYCPSPVCTPSRMSMLTGRYPHENEVWTNNQILDSGIPTFAHAMGAGGYYPVLMGRMHALGIDQLHGYAERPIGDHGSNFPGGFAAARGFGNSVKNSGPGQSAYQVLDEDVTAATVNFLNRLGVNKRAGQSAEPFCLSVGLMLPHSPYVARQADYELYKGSMTLPRYPEPFGEQLHPFLKWWREYSGQIEFRDEEILRARASYWALVTRMDKMIGEILGALKKNNLENDTVVLYMSDHGDQVGEHGLWMKRTFYEGSVKVPAILSWPGVLPEGKQCDRVVGSLDFNATMLDALGAPPLVHSHGRSLLDLVRAEDQEWEDIAISEYCMYEGHYQRMIRSGDWKLVYYHGQEPQLFNLESDPNELNDQAQNSDFREVRKELTALVLDRWDPEWIAEKMVQKKQELELIRDWVRETKPTEQFQWDLLPEMNYLD